MNGYRKRMMAQGWIDKKGYFGAVGCFSLKLKGSIWYGIREVVRRGGA